MIRAITREELKGMIDRNEDFTLVDVLSPNSYEQNHIPGAINIPLGEIERSAKRLLNKNEKIVVYCGSFQCTMSPQAAEKLTKLGFKNVCDYEGGLQDWEEAGFPLVSSERARAVGE